MRSEQHTETEIQRAYYAKTAKSYDQMHVESDDGKEHFLALSILVGMIQHYEVRSVLDIGSGTGRAIGFIKQRLPTLQVVGIEPVRELREIGYRKGLLETELVAGDATKLPYADGSFDLVCEFGVLHHIRRPEIAVSEMLRVGKKAIFISDSNNFGQGSRVSRMFKQLANAFGCWRLVDLVKTKGKGYTISEGDGLGYSYSVFNNYRQIRKSCEVVHLLNTKDGEINPYRTASHIALFGLKSL